jgi:hypothetical protein
MSAISPTLDVLYGRFMEAEADLTEAAMYHSHVIHEHPEDTGLADEAFEDLEDARTGYRMASILLEAREIQEGHAEWPSTLEARVYLDALRQIAAHIEEMTAPEGLPE